MREAYIGGSTGAVVSGLVWVIAGVLASFVSARTSILVFFFGGMLIFPLSTLLAKLYNRSGKHQKENPLGTMALEGTITLFVGLFIAYILFPKSPDWFYGIMLLIIGCRYLLFQTIYGLRIYWLFGSTLLLAGFFCIMSNQPIHMAAILGGVIELIFAFLIFRSNEK